MISGLLNNDNPLGSFGTLIDQFGPMLGLLAAVNPAMTKMCLQIAKSMIDEMIRVYDETGQLVFPAVPEPKIAEPIVFDPSEVDNGVLTEKILQHPGFQEALRKSALPNDQSVSTMFLPDGTTEIFDASTDEGYEAFNKRLASLFPGLVTPQEESKDPVVSLDMLNDVQLQAARALYAEAAKDGFMGVYAPTEENFRLLREWQEEKEHAKQPPKQRRKRRTKAQIAADNAAKLARSEPTTE